MAGAASFHAGLAAEEQVAQWYVRRGAQMLHHRWRGQGGEIDLILQEGATVVCVEVKKSRDFRRALERIQPRQVARVMAAAEEFLVTQPKGLLTDLRFDVALVDGCGDIQVIENAFAP